MTAEPTTQSAYMRIREAAAFFGVTKDCLYKWVYEGIMPANCYWQPRPHGRYFFNRARCEAWRQR